MLADSGKLDRRELTRALLADRGELAVIAGLGAPCWDITAIGDHKLNLPLWGGMGAAAMIGLGLALAQPTRPVLVLTGDGEMLMGIGALATIAVKKPKNLAIVVQDNEHYGETGMQETATKYGVDLVAMAKGAGFQHTMLVTKLRVLVDRSSVEVFAQDGRVVLTDRVFPDPASLGTALEADGPARLVKLDAWRLAPSVPYSPADSASAACTSR